MPPPSLPPSRSHGGSASTTSRSATPRRIARTSGMVRGCSSTRARTRSASCCTSWRPGRACPSTASAPGRRPGTASARFYFLSFPRRRRCPGTSSWSPSTRLASRSDSQRLAEVVAGAQESSRMPSARARMISPIIPVRVSTAASVSCSCSTLQHGLSPVRPASCGAAASAVDPAKSARPPGERSGAVRS